MAAIQSIFTSADRLITGAISTLVGAPLPPPSQFVERIAPTTPRATIAGAGNPADYRPPSAPMNIGSGTRLPVAPGAPAPIEAPAWKPISASENLWASRDELITQMRRFREGEVWDATIGMSPEEQSDAIQNEYLSAPPIGRDDRWDASMSPDRHAAWRVMPRHWSDSTKEAAIRVLQGEEAESRPMPEGYGGSYERATRLYGAGK